MSDTMTNGASGYKVWVDTGEAKPSTNTMVFDTAESANNYGKDLHRRWLMCHGFEVRPTDEEPEYSCESGGMLTVLDTGDSHKPADRVQL